MAQLLPLLVIILLVALRNADPVPVDDFGFFVPSLDNAVSVDYRLPTDVMPASYRMLFIPDLTDNFTFHGESEIVIDVIVKTKRVVLHANDLTIKTATVSGPDGESIVAEPAALDIENDFLVIDLGTELVPQTKYTLKLVFEGKLNDDGKGFYRVSYEGDDGKPRWSAATHFEPTSARRAFPCWDEPHLKATFDISIKYPKDLHAISNMHVIATEVDQTNPTHYVTTFATTPKMSTYIVAFVVTDYESLSNKDGSFKIWTKPSVIQRAKFFMKFAGMMMKELETYTGIDYASHGLKKMDTVALFKSGSKSAAMENWGLITFSEFTLPTANDSSTSKKASVMMHELAHQWFGNLVSPKSWKYTWLNEGFATYFHYVMTDKIWPKWRLKDLQVIQCLQSIAFSVDSAPTSPAMNRDIYSQTEIMGKFSLISYYKAASVIRTIAHVLGEDKFQIALRKYLNKLKFKAATSDDLFEEFVKVFPTLTGSAVEPMDILNNWVNTPGFPVISVIRDYERNTVYITQERFLKERDLVHTETYYVPINYATQEKKDFYDTTVTSWIDKNDSITKIEGNFKKNEWVIFNKQHFGYYRVNYDEQNWKMISDFLQSKNYIDVHVLNRAQLVDDALNLAQIGKLRWGVALNVLQFLKQEVDHVPWYPAYTGLQFLWGLLSKTEFDRKFKNYVQELTDNILKDVISNESLEDDDFTKETRHLIVHVACAMGSQTCQNETLAKVTEFLDDPTKMDLLSSHTRILFLCSGVRHADRATWNKLHLKYLQDGNYDVFLSLGCTSDREILEDYLSELTISSWSFPQRGLVFRNIITRSEEGVDAVLDFIIENADKIYRVSGNSSDELEEYTQWLGSAINTEEQLEKLENASNEHVKAVSADGIEKARKRLEWLNSHREEFKQFFNEKSSISIE